MSLILYLVLSLWMGVLLITTTIHVLRLAASLFLAVLGALLWISAHAIELSLTLCRIAFEKD